MPNEYSIAIHDHISRIIEAAQREREAARAQGDVCAESYSRGRLDELSWIREVLKDNIDLKNFTYY